MGRVPVQKRLLEGVDEVLQKLVSVLLPAGAQVWSLTQFYVVCFVKLLGMFLQSRVVCYVYYFVTRELLILGGM